MDFTFTPQQQAFRDEVRAFVKQRLPEDMRQRLRLGHPPSKQDTVTWQRILHERGWAAPHWPRHCGGAELGPMERLILLDGLYRAPAPLPQVFNVTMLGPVLMKFGTPAQCDHFLPKLANLDSSDRSEMRMLQRCTDAEWPLASPRQVVDADCCARLVPCRAGRR